MNRADWQAMADERLDDAGALLAAGRWSAGYHLAGYSVESGLKACILRDVENNSEVIFTDKRYSEECWDHRPIELAKLAKPETQLTVDMAANPVFRDHWREVISWDVASRYERKTQTEAEGLLEAIADRTNGVLPWIKGYW